MSKKLSPRETEILKMIWEGVDSQETALLLGISVRTVETHRNKILTKLGVTNTVGGRSAVLVRAIRRGLELGILEPPLKVGEPEARAQRDLAAILAAFTAPGEEERAP